ncbi:MAG: hypothetical protein KGJ03_09610 [Betaproteobacteria bacterium]|nr:hypothetical protein [Betaproteobacteria bacterium]MDE1955967.1 hypothetical protein [Betaproteobacteria bacterium]MDE2152144.1 hypothetical protein [Betaproteobacteria bacterium]
MNLFERLRSLTRRGGILPWMLLLAYAWAPLAAALPTASRTVVVPFCTAQEGSAGHQAPAPRNIALRFTAAAQAAGPLAWALPAGALPGLSERPREARVAHRAEAAPGARLLWRRPAPRGPPEADPLS